MTRISNLAANTQLVNQLLRTQARLFDLQVQVSTEKVSQSYEGIATDSRRLINLENTRNNLTKFISNNKEMGTQLDVTASVIDGIDKTIGDFRGALINFNIGDKTEQTRISDIQKNAFQSLQALESFLNTSIDGRFIFAGARTTTEPVNFGFKTLSDLQSRFDGSTIQFATTREAQIANFTVGETVAFSTKSFNSGAVSMTFDDTVGPDTDTITAAAGTFRYPDGTNLSVGAEIVISGTAGPTNDGTFTIGSVSVDGSTVTLTGAGIAADQTSSATATALTPMTFADNGALADTITAPAGTFQDAAGNLLGRGTQITISNTTTNDGTFTISSVSADGSTATLTSANTGAVSMTFDDTVGPDTDTITAAAGTFRNLDGSPLVPGSTITITGTPGAINDGTFTIGSVSADGSTVTLTGAGIAADETVAATAVAGDALTNQTDGSSTAVVAAATNFLTFQRDNAADPPQSIITGQGAAFVNVKAGSLITVSGTANNDGTYEVLSVPNTGQIVVRTQMFTDEVATGAGIVAADGTRVDSSTTGNLTFVRDNGATPPLSRLTAATAGSLLSLKVGQKITINGTALGPPTNNGVYTVVANDGTNLDIVTQMLTDEGTLSTPTINFTSGGSEVTFTNNTAPTKDTIQANAGRFSGLSKGMAVIISGAADPGNNQTVTIDSVSADGSTITIKEQVTAAAPDAGTLTFRAPFADGVISATSYYKGDQTSLTHRVDSDRDFEFDLNALDPAFEKAIRAMLIIAQGEFQSEGGLDQNTGRIADALFLLDSSLKRTVSGTPPFGTELSGNMDQIEIDIAINQILIRDTNDSHLDFIGFLEGSIVDVENADPLQTIVRLIDDQRALEASFQALASIRKLTLLNFI